MNDMGVIIVTLNESLFITNLNKIFSSEVPKKSIISYGSFEIYFKCK